jgi:lysine 6-dehydrogenase
LKQDEGKSMPKAKSPIFTVLGGAGAMGQITVKDLIETASPDSQIIIADYQLEKAQLQLKKTKRKGVKALQVNILEPQVALKALKGTTVLINTLPYEYNLQVMELALTLGAHYIDLGGLFHMTRKQMALHERFEQAQLTALMGMGAAPGITNLLARLAADPMQSVHAIHIRLGAVDKTRYRPKPVLPISYSFKTIMEEFSLEPAIYSKGRYRFVKPMSGMNAHRFPSPVGVQYPMFTLHSEVVNLAETYKSKGIDEVSFKIAFDRDFVEKVRFLRDLGLASQAPLAFKQGEVAPIDLVNAVVMNQPASEAVGEIKQYEIIRAIVKGVEQGKRVTWINDLHTTGMPQWEIGTDIDTGSPPSVAAQMLVNGQIKAKGVLSPEQAVPPEPFFAALEKRGMHIHSSRKNGWTTQV